jgi:hypothetical protein
MGEIHFDERNYRKHSGTNKSRIARSLKDYGAGRSCVVDRDGYLIAGNGVYEQAQKLGMRVKEVESDGTELVVVKRTDLGVNDERRKGLAFADNATSDNVEWNRELLVEDFDKKFLANFGVEIKDTEMLSQLDYVGIYYEPDCKPELRLADCVDFRKFNEKIKVIDESNLNDEIKSVLRWFAYRFIRIDFESVANYYAFNASDEERKVIERLRLVLVDNGAQGFVEDDLLRLIKMIDDSDEE